MYQNLIQIGEQCFQPVWPDHTAVVMEYINAERLVAKCQLPLLRTDERVDVKSMLLLLE